MRNRPLGIHRIAGETAAELVVNTARAHLLQRKASDMTGIFVAAFSVAPQAEFDHFGMRKFWRAAKAAAPRVKRIEHLPAGGGDRFAGEFRRFRRNGRDRRIHRRHQLPILLANIAGLFTVIRGYPIQQVAKPGQSIAGGLGKIGSTEKWRGVGGQEHRQRPATRSLGQHGVRGLVYLVDVGPLFAVHLDVHEQLVHQRGNLSVFERFVGHHMAPMASRIADRKQDRLALGPGQRQRLSAPFVPVHRVLRVLLQVRRGTLC